MTDCGGGTDAVAQMKAGNDVLMPGNPNQSKEIVNAVKEGNLDETVLNKNVERILNILLETPRFKGYEYTNKPEEELAAFGKTKLLEPGETQTLSFMINKIDLASFDTDASAWVAEAGIYNVKIGASSKDIRQTASFELKKELTLKKVNKALSPQKKISWGNTMPE